MCSSVNANIKAQNMSDAKCDGSTLHCSPMNARPKKEDKPVSYVSKAYFAKLVEKESISEKDYLVKTGKMKDTHKSIINKHKGSNLAELKKDYPNLTPGATIKLKIHEGKKNVFFEKIESATIGRKVYIIVETSNLNNSKVSVEIIGCNNTTFVKPGEVVKMQSGSTEKLRFEESVGGYLSKANYQNSDTLSDKVVIEVSLQPIAKTAKKDWYDKITTSVEKKAYFYLSLTATSSNDVFYSAEDANLSNPNKEKGVFLNQKNKWFRLIRCCSEDITTEQLKSIFTKADDTRLEEMASAFNEAYSKFYLDTCIRRCHFFAQMREEVGANATIKEESLNYTPSGLLTQFQYFRNHPDEADLYGRTVNHAADQQAIANRAYALRLGNGAITTGNGWAYRGKGFLQLTGKDNYSNAQGEIDNKFPDSNLDIVQNADDILTVRGAMISAMAFWSMNSISVIADIGDSDNDVDAVTGKINLLTGSYQQRRTHFLTAKKAFDLDNCAIK